ncbi:MAG: tetratricopeptide repeat protein [Bacteroidales bacterium]|jgi:Ca-activated chloride channel family protein|nr:tetratricopeptide repeat protein [Bacteroidales bacterium]
MKAKLIYILLILPMLVWGQEERKHIREGYKAYMDEDYNEAEIGFRKAEEANKESYVAKYNTSAALYQQEKLEESGKRFAELMAEAPNDIEEAKLLHNLGNVHMKGQKYPEAVDAYKKSMRLNPDDEDTRYNLAYALEKLREQQEQQQQNQDQDQDQDKENKDQDQEQQQNEENKDQEKQEQQQEKESQDQQEQQQEIQKQELNKEEAERLLNAILQKEKDVKEKVDLQKAKATKIKTDKDW